MRQGGEAGVLAGLLVVRGGTRAGGRKKKVTNLPSYTYRRLGIFLAFGRRAFGFAVEVASETDAGHDDGFAA